MMYSLEATGLRKEYTGFTLKDVDIRIPKGSIVGFIGENGAGKTTTLKLILHAIKRDGGSVTLFGKTDPSPKEEALLRQDIGVVFDDTGLHETLNTKDIDSIMRGIYRNWDSSLFQEHLTRFELPNKALKDYSRGMKKKLSIALALSHRPKLLLLDEPTSGLDPVVRSEMLDVFLDFIQDEEHSILLSSHITSDLERIADYVILIHRGEIIFSRSKDDLLDSCGILRCAPADFDRFNQSEYLSSRKSSVQCELLVGDKSAMRRRYPDAVVDDASLDEIMLFYVKGESL